MAKRVRKKCAPALLRGNTARYRLRRQAYIFLVILKHECRRRRRDSDHYFLSLATQETADYVYIYKLKRHFQHNANASAARETPPSARKFSNTVNVVECRFLEPILHLSARGCSRGWPRGHIRWVTWARSLSAIFSRDCRARVLPRTSIDELFPRAGTVHLHYARIYGSTYTLDVHTPCVLTWFATSRFREANGKIPVSEFNYIVYREMYLRNVRTLEHVS